MRLKIVTILILLISYYKVIGEYVVGRIFLAIEYSNYGNRDAEGEVCDFWENDRICDVYLRVCVSSSPGSNCDMMNELTDHRWNTASLSLSNGSELSGVIYLKTSEKFSLSIEAWDYDDVTKDDLIGKFENKEQFVRDLKLYPTQINLYRSDYSRKNAIKIEASMWKSCSKDYFGDACQHFCVPIPGESFCDKNGTKVCLPGSECEKTADHCQNFSCGDNGVCIPNNASFSCICNPGWSGRRCDEVVNNTTLVSVTISTCIIVTIGIIVVIVVSVCYKHHQQVLRRESAFVYALDMSTNRCRPKSMLENCDEHVYEEIGDPYYFTFNKLQSTLTQTVIDRQNSPSQDALDCPPVPPRESIPLSAPPLKPITKSDTSDDIAYASI